MPYSVQLQHQVQLKSLKSLKSGVQVDLELFHETLWLNTETAEAFLLQENL